MFINVLNALTILAVFSSPIAALPQNSGGGEKANLSGPPSASTPLHYGLIERYKLSNAVFDHWTTSATCRGVNVRGEHRDLTLNAAALQKAVTLVFLNTERTLGGGREESVGAVLDTGKDGHHGFHWVYVKFEHSLKAGDKKDHFAIKQVYSVDDSGNRVNCSYA